jgi:1-acyl-sn-glycerol-3-phosphate acyltransferase
VENLLRLDHRPRGRPGTDAVFERVRTLIGRILHAFLNIGVEGRENVPANGPVILAANHSSFLDAILLAALSPRPIAFMTKNSQFDNRMLFGVLRWAGAFPVRRYTTDVGAVRNARRILAAGRVLGLFPEGERCWDGLMQPFKRTTVRLLLALGVPVVPVGIAGAYGLMPRWSTRIRRVPVAVRFGPPLALPVIAPADQTEADIAACAERLHAVIGELSRQR